MTFKCEKKKKSEAPSEHKDFPPMKRLADKKEILKASWSAEATTGNHSPEITALEIIILNTCWVQFYLK